MKKALTLASIFLALSPLAVYAAADSSADVGTPSDQSKSPATTNEDKFPGIDQLSGTFDVTSNYIFRGISQSSNYPAFQGGLTYSLPFGFYVNTWGSNVSFTGTKASVELDTVAGIAGDIKDDLSYNLSYSRYNYPGAQYLAYNELIGVLNYKFLQATIGYSANIYATHKSGIYYNAGINYDVPAKYVFNIEDINFQALFGHDSLPRAAGNSYNDYLVSISKTIKAYTFTIAWTDTNGRQHNPPYDGSQFIGTIAAAF